MRRVALIAMLCILSAPMADAAPAPVAGTCKLITIATVDGGIFDNPNQRYWDPILFPGVIGYPNEQPFLGPHGPAHWHNFFGNTSLTPNGITDPSAPTTCTGGYTGSFWVPRLLGYNADAPGGYPILPESMSYRFRKGVPVGYSAIAHDATWDCGPGTTKTDAPQLCSNDLPQAVVRFPEIKLRLRTVFRLRVDFTALSVGGMPIAPGSPCFPENGPPFCEDEHSFHADVMTGGEA